MVDLRPLRVLHVPDTVGGNPQGLSRAERELGLESISVALTPSPFGYAPDEVLRPPGTGRVRFEARRLRLLVRALRHFDVVHFNFGRTVVPTFLAYRDLPLLRRAGKVVAVTFQGDDVRGGDVAPPWPSLQAALPDRYDAATTAERRRRVDAFARHAHLIWYLNPELAHVLPPRAQFMPYAHVDPRSWSPSPKTDEGGSFVIVHAPSDRAVKGTQYVINAVDALKRDGIDVELRLVEGISHQASCAIYASADLAVDQLLAGWYGGFAVEALALGIPVVSYLREGDLVVLHPKMRRDLPIISATPETVTEVLRACASAPIARRVEAKQHARRYAERWHDPVRIAESVIERYRAVHHAPSSIRR